MKSQRQGNDSQRTSFLPCQISGMPGFGKFGGYWHQIDQMGSEFCGAAPCIDPVQSVGTRRWQGAAFVGVRFLDP